MLKRMIMLLFDVNISTVCCFSAWYMSQVIVKKNVSLKLRFPVPQLTALLCSTVQYVQLHFSLLCGKISTICR
jgi:hypothetical protein